MPEPQAVADFFSNWPIYRAVIEHDCMEHRAIGAALGRVLARRPRPFSLLDLGCGDAAMIAPALAGTRIRRYCGVDCAAPALALARETLRGIEAGQAAEIELRVGDILSTVEAPDPERFEVILASFVLHHLGSAAKRRFLAAARRRLAPEGELLLVDVVRLPGEDRAAYLERYWRFLADWPVGADYQARLRAHISGYDFPEELGTQPAWAAELGFRTVETLYQGGRETQAGWRFAL